MTVYISVFVALLGLLMYALCANPKLAEIGRIMFFCGLFAFLFGDTQLLRLFQKP